MKKVLFLFTLLLMVTACSTDSEPSTGVQTTNVAISIDQPSTTVTGKQIKRGNIPVWVNTLKIKATSNVFSNYSVETPFTFDEQNGASYIGLDNVAVGSNSFTASTTTDSPQFYQLTNFTVNSGDLNAKFASALDNIDNENPYVLYTGATTANVASTGTNVISIPMTTLNGRLLSVFQLADNLKSLGLQAKITASVSGLSSLTAITKGNELVTFKWSDVNSVLDKEVTYKVEVSAINNQSVILKSYEVKQKVLASTSLSCYYTINSDGITLTRNDVKITLNWQEWKNLNCEDCNN